jgi:predicted PurR-regulated permease PerM
MPLISIIAALLSLIPYIGNMVGFVLAMAMAAFSGGKLIMFFGYNHYFFNCPIY